MINRVKTASWLLRERERETDRERDRERERMQFIFEMP